MVSPQEAEDSAQEVFSKIANNLKGFEDWAKLSTWIYRIATNTTLDRAGALACGRKLPDKS